MPRGKVQPAQLLLEIAQTVVHVAFGAAVLQVLRMNHCALEALARLLHTSGMDVEIAQAAQGTRGNGARSGIER